MINLIDEFLNRITMYRLVLYYLIVLILAAAIFGFLDLIPYDPFSILFSTLILVGVSWLTNQIFSRVFEAPTNVESVFITALILALIVSPAKTFNDFLFLVVAGVLSMAVKYILAVGKKHLFNPAAAAVVLTALAANQSASWWVGNLSMLPLVMIGGLLVVRKVRREDMVFSFLAAAALTIAGFSLAKGSDLLGVADKVIFHSSLFFFAFVMLTEPLTSPATPVWQNSYAILVGFLFAPGIHLGSLYSTPELALVMGNLFSYFVSPKEKLILHLKEKVHTAADTFDFVFFLSKKLAFTPGQYMEWTLMHEKVDSRGNRRYFTLASSPTEDTLRLGVKFNEPSSSFKKAMLNLDNQTPIVATGRAGDFTLPRDKGKKLVFLAGGIGITPYRSILKYLIDKGEKRDIALFYFNKVEEEIVYRDIFREAQEKLGIKVIYSLTDQSRIPDDWQGMTGRLDWEKLAAVMPDYKERTYYLSGPWSMVTAYEAMLKESGLPQAQIKKDFFPGFT